MDKNKEKLFFAKHLIDLSNCAYNKEIRTYTDFLNINEISIFNSILPDLPKINYSLWGGIHDAERRKICFHGELEPEKVERKALSTIDFESAEGGYRYKNEIKDISIINPSLFPISCIHVTPVNLKFSETLTHRDYLGTVLSLGLLRNKIGDIVIEEKEAYIFCDSMISKFIIDNLVKIRNTIVKSSMIYVDDLNINKKYEIISGSVSSIRLDSVIKTAFHISRNNVTPYINSGKVSVNDKEIYSNSFSLKEGDTVSVRGLGKFIYNGQRGVTKKNKINISILKYI